MSEALLIVAGAIGAVVAIIHGVLMQRIMMSKIVMRLDEAPALARQIRAFVPSLMHFTTFGWFLGGFGLVAGASVLPFSSVAPLAGLVGLLFLYGAIANFTATRGRHPGWVGMAIATGLIAYALVVGE